MSHQNNNDEASSSIRTPLDRRELIAYSAAFGTTFLAAQGLYSQGKAETQAVKPVRDRRRYDMKKSINLWAFPYPQQWSLKECFQLAKDAGFDGVEINFALEGEFSDQSPESEFAAIGQLAKQVGIAISGVCSFLFWPYSLTQNDETRRAKGLELASKMIRAAKVVGTDNLLVVPGAVWAPWMPEYEPVPNDVCDSRAKAAISQLVPLAEKSGVSINIENIFANGYLFSPQEINAFIDSFHSSHVQAHFDTGNIMQYQTPEHWVPILGKRIKNIHFKEWDRRGSQEFDLHTFRTLLDGTTNWPAVVAALDKVGYRGYLTFEYFHPLQHYPEALVYQTSDALDWILGRKG